MLTNWSINSLTKQTRSEISPVSVPHITPQTSPETSVSLIIGWAAIFWLITILLRDIGNCGFIYRLFFRYCTRQRLNRFQQRVFKEGIVWVHQKRPERYTIVDSATEGQTNQDYIPITVTSLNRSGELEFTSGAEKITELNLPPANTVKRRIFNHIAPVVSQRTKTIELLRLLEQKQEQLNRLATLALSSAIDYQPHNYLQKLDRLEINLNQVKKLIEIQENYIREGLIAVELLTQTEVEESLPDLTPQRQLIEAKYQETSAFILAYLELLAPSQTQAS